MSNKFYSKINNRCELVRADVRDLDNPEFWENVKYIKNNAFEEFVFPQNYSLVIPDHVELEGSCFVNSSGLTSVVLPKNMKVIPFGLFSECCDLKFVKLPDNLEYIAGCAFLNCALSDIKLPEGLEGIGVSAFGNCPLTNIEFPESLKYIGSNAFSNTKIEELEIPENVETFSTFMVNNFEKVVVKGEKTKIDIPSRGKGACEFKNKDVNFTINFNTKQIDGRNDLEYLCRSLRHSTSEARKGNNLSKILLAKDKSCIKFLSDNIDIPNIDDYIPFTCKQVWCQEPYRGKFPVNQIREVKDKYITSASDLYDILTSINGRSNYVDCVNLLQNGKINRMVHPTILKILPNSQIDNLFVNNNIKTFFRLFSKYGFDKLDSECDKENAKGELLKIYYALGGFSPDIKVRDKAYNYVDKILEKEEVEVKSELSQEKENTEQSDEETTILASHIHQKFSHFALKNKPYNPLFAEFFMKHYLDNENFMTFRVDSNGKFYTDAELKELKKLGVKICDTYDESIDYNELEYRDDENDIEDEAGIIIVSTTDYLAQAHNGFDKIIKLYPNMTVRGNTNRDLLTPKFVAEHVSINTYQDVHEGNEKLAELVGSYGYDEDAFCKIQSIYEKSKKIKDDYIILADKDNQDNPIQYKFLDKDDPVGFVLGNITNCCQHMGGAAESCVVDGFTSNSSGFLVFEKDVVMNGKPTGEKRIIGQAYVWYDPRTQTVCYDNIEIPNTVLKELNKNSKNIYDLVSALERSADAVMHAMNTNGSNKVKQVTTGEGYNDLVKVLKKKYQRINDEMPKNPKAYVYSDANYAQYIIRTYDQTTQSYANNIECNLSKANQLIDQFQNDIEQHM